MSEKTFDELMRQYRELQELCPKVMQDAAAYQNLQNLAVHTLVSESLPGTTVHELMFGHTKMLPEQIQPASIEVEEDVLIDVDSFTVETYGKLLLRMRIIHDAAKNGYMAVYGSFPEQQKTLVRGFLRDTYMYPKKWLTNFLENFREKFPYHWSECPSA